MIFFLAWKWPVTKVDSFDVTNDPLVAVTNLEKFLNLDPEISEKNFIYNSTKVRILFFFGKSFYFTCVKNVKIIIAKNMKSNILWNYFNNISRGFTVWRISTQLIKSLVRHFVIMTSFFKSTVRLTLVLGLNRLDNDYGTFYQVILSWSVWAMGREESILSCRRDWNQN